MALFQSLTRLFGVFAFPDNPSLRSRDDLLSQARRLVALGATGDGLKPVLDELAQGAPCVEEIRFLSDHRLAGASLAKAFAFRAALPLWEARVARGEYRQACGILLDAYQSGNGLALETLGRVVVLPPGRGDGFRTALVEALAERSDRDGLVDDLNRAVRDMSAALHRLAVESGGIGSLAHAGTVWKCPVVTNPRSETAQESVPA